MKEKHYNTPKYFLNPLHPISVDLIGTGGTGSHTLMGLANISNALKGFGHPGLQVTAWDNDKVESHNVGRQFFSKPDIGQNKAVCLVTRINRMYGFQWKAIPTRYKPDSGSNIVISCVDSIKSRKEIYLHLSRKQTKATDEQRTYYWIDCGNSKDSGQIIIGTLDKSAFKLPHFFDRFPDVKEAPEIHSCSMADSLSRQDLLINQTMALHCCSMIWRMFRTGKIESAGMYVNHKLYQTSSIPI